MKYYSGSFTHGITSTNAVLSIMNMTTIRGFRLTIGSLAAAGENNRAHFSEGSCDGTNEHAHSILTTDDPLTITRTTQSYCITHYDIDPSTFLTRRVISATFVQFGTDGNGHPTIELDYDRATTDYQQFIEVWGE